MNYDIQKDECVQAIAAHFENHGFPLRLVGGAVRDILIGQIPKDFDFCTTAQPDTMMTMIDDGWKVFPTGLEHGTVTFMSLYGSFEVTTLRKDVETDGRHAVVEFTNDWEVDAARRDFTINAMSIDMVGNLYDYFDGQKDLKNGQVKFVGDPVARIKEDALRMIRFLRFEARFGGKSKYTDSYFACVRNQHLIKNVSHERVWQEVKSASRSPDSFRRFMSYMITGDWLAQFGVMFNNNVENSGHINRFVKEFPTFGVGAFLVRGQVEEFSNAFKLSKKEQDELHFFVHMKDSIINEERFEEMATLGFNKRWMVAVAKYQGKDQLSKHIDKWIVPVFPVSGKDLIDIGITPGKNMGYILEILRSQWVISRFTMTKEDLLHHNKEYIKNDKQNISI